LKYSVISTPLTAEEEEEDAVAAPFFAVEVEASVVEAG